MLSANTIPVQAASQCSAPRVGVQLNFNPTNMHGKVRMLLQKPRSV
jgi:hypothetical protein